MAQETTNKTKNKMNFAKTIGGIFLIIISFLLLSIVFNKIKKERLEYKQTTGNVSKKTENPNGNSNIIQNNNGITENRRKNSNRIDEIDIPQLFGSEIPNVSQSIEGNKNNTENNVNNNKINQNKENTQNTNTIKNTKEKAIKEKENIQQINNAYLENIKKNSKKNMSKYLSEFGGDFKKAKKVYVWNLIRKTLTPIFIGIFIFSYIYQYLMGLKDNRIWKQGYYIRIVSVIIIFILQFIPFIYSLIVKSWGN